MGKKLVIVTGATGTLGVAVCKRLIKAGYTPVAVAREQSKLSKLEVTFPGAIYTHTTDVANAADVQGLFTQDFMQNNTLCGVVTCAGILTMGATETFDINAWDDTIRTNISGTYYVFRAAIPHMKNGGCLIAVGSRWADGAKYAVAYSTSKAALRGMVSAMQKEYAGSAIRPVLVSPGSIASDMSQSVNKSTATLDILHADDVAKIITDVLQSPQRTIFSEITIKAYNYDLTDEYAT